MSIQPIQPPMQPVMDDQYFAQELRLTVQKLSSLIEQARKTGLTINVRLANVGQPNWEGYQDAIEVSRKY